MADVERINHDPRVPGAGSRLLIFRSPRPPRASGRQAHRFGVNFPLSKGSGHTGKIWEGEKKQKTKLVAGLGQGQKFGLVFKCQH